MVSHLHSYFPKNIYFSWALYSGSTQLATWRCAESLEPFLLQFVEWGRELIIGSFRFWEEDDYEYKISQY